MGYNATIISTIVDLVKTITFVHGYNASIISTIVDFTDKQFTLDLAIMPQ